MAQKRSLRSGAGAQNIPKDEADLSPQQRAQFDKMKALADKYKNKSEAEIMQELGRAAKAGRQSGMLSDGKIEEIKAKLSPMLDESQRKKLENVIKMIK